MSTVVLVIDGTSSPCAVLSLYRSLARVPDRVVLVPLGGAHPEQGPKGRDASEGASMHALGAVMRALEDCGAVSVTRPARADACAAAVLQAADDAHADLIILGITRRTGLFKLFTGSVATEVERRATVPVIVAPRSIRSTYTPHFLNGRQQHAA